MIHWFSFVHKRFSQLMNELMFAKEQMKIHHSIYMDQQGGEFEQISKNMYDMSFMVVEDIKQNYNKLLRKPIYRIPAWFMRFHEIKND